MAVVDLTLAQPTLRYQVRIEAGLLARLGPAVAEAAPHAKCAAILDEAIEADWGRPAARSLRDAGFDCAVASLAVSEKRKTLGTVRTFYEVLLEHRLERRSPVVSIGGGILGDMAGFAAATYLRGVPLVQAPTTLLAMVDASVGGKTGVNAPQGKNLLGSFHQPVLVAIDPDALTTLPARQVRCGLAECVKHAVIRDPELFSWIERRVDDVLALDSGALAELVERNVRIKAAVVQEDEREAGVRAHLNFGHTFAHAIEACNRFLGRPSLLHGEAVAAGMVAATRLAIDQRLCQDAGLLERLVRLLERIGLPTCLPAEPPMAALMTAMGHDKKVAGGAIRLVLPARMGEVVVTDQVDPVAIEQAWVDLAAPPGA
ncbi:MAG: 3-dehydroquinate synthase [Planctomycetota bacterium]